MTGETMPKPERIVSLVPSTTETLFALGAGDQVVGVTRFCVHPSEARARARIVGGTKNPRVPTILSLEPDLVLANQEENRKEDVESLREKVPVQVFYPRDVPEAIADIRSLGSLLGVPERAAALAKEIESARGALTTGEHGPFRCLYFIWRRPYMVAGPDTFIEALLAEAGFVNAAPRNRGRYPEMGIDEVAVSGAEVLLLSSEPYPFEEKHRAELVSALGESEPPGASVLLVDGELLSWHGARLRRGLPYLISLAAMVSSSKSASARPFPDPSP
jgi:ABC-type Fe3+-hydroxamate transport system substrate-binding protein